MIQRDRTALNQRHAWLIGLLLIGVLFCPGRVVAQEPETTDATAAQAGGSAQQSAEESPSAAEEFADVEDIVVTTERRRQTLQDVAAVTKAVAADDLRQMGVNKFTDLSNALPQLNIGNREGNVEIFIRGIGDDNNTELSEPRSAILLDGIYLSRPRGLGSFFFDLERVELNIGPQGTLRGRNATGGSLNIVSKRPELGRAGGYINIGYGNFNQREIEGAINVPFGDDFALRVASYHVKNDSRIGNAGPLDITESRATDDLAVRASARWRPLDNLDINITGDFLTSKGTGYGGLDYFPYYQSQLADGSADLNLQNDIEDLDDPFRAVTQGAQPRQEQQVLGVRAQLQYEFDYLTVEYLGAVRSMDFVFNRTSSDAFFPGFDAFFGVDLAAASPNAATTDFLADHDRVYFDQAFDSIVQELRLFANEGERVRWTAGAFYFRETGFAHFNTTSDSGNVFAGVEFAFPDVKRENFAFYGDATVDILPSLRVTGGIRYTNESLSRTGFGATYLFLFPTDTQTDPPSGCCAPQRIGSEGFRFAGRDRQIYTDDVDISSGAGRIELFRDGVRRFGNNDDVDDQLDLVLDAGLADSADISAITPNDATRRDDFVNWRLRLEFNPYSDGLLYAGISTGTNSGGFNDAVRTPSGDIVTPEFGTESVLVAEFGSKNKFTLAGYQAIVNVAAFWYAYQDQQFTVLAPVGGTPMGGDQAGVVSIRQNVGDSRILGLDLEYVQNLPLHFRLKTNLQVLNTEFTNPSGPLVDTRFNFPNGPDDTIGFNPTGNRLPKASDLSGSVSLAQFIPTSIGWFEWVASLGFRTKYFLTIFNGDGELPEINAQTNPNLDEEQISNLQSSVRDSAGSASDVVNGYLRLDLGASYSPSSSVRIELYAKNVTNRAYAQTGLLSPNLNLRFLNDPRTFGGRVRVTF